MEVSTETLEAIAELERTEFELKTLLPELFERLKLIYQSAFHSYESHGEYFAAYCRQLVTMGPKEIDLIASNCFRILGGGSRFAKELYQGACLELLKAHTARNTVPVDDSAIGSSTINLKLIASVLRELRNLEIPSPKDESTRLARAGGIGRARSFEPVKKKLLELLDSNAPVSGWKTKQEARKAVEVPLQQFVTENDIKLSAVALDSTVAGWARKSPEIAAAFERHVKRKPKKKHGPANGPAHD